MAFQQGHEFKYKAYLRIRGRKEHPKLPRSTYYRWLKHYEQQRLTDQPKATKEELAESGENENHGNGFDMNSDSPLPDPLSTDNFRKNNLSISELESVSGSSSDSGRRHTHDTSNHENSGDDIKRFYDDENSEISVDESYDGDIESLCDRGDKYMYDEYDSTCTASNRKPHHDEKRWRFGNIPSKRVCLRHDEEMSFHLSFEDGPAEEVVDNALPQNDEVSFEAGGRAHSAVSETVIAGHEVGANATPTDEENQLREQRLARFLEDLDFENDLDEEQFREQIHYYEDEVQVETDVSEAQDDEVADDQGNASNQEDHQDRHDDWDQQDRRDDGDQQDRRDDGDHQDRCDDGENNDIPLFDGAGITKAQTQILLLSYIFKHDVSNQQLEDFCKIMDVLFPGILPKSAYMFKKGIPEVKGVCTYYLYCSNCSGLLGLSEMLDEVGECSVCSQGFQKKKSLAKGSYFIVFPMQEQIRTVLEGCNVAKMQRPANFTHSDICYDLVSGGCLKSMFTRNDISETDLTALWNFDGVPVFNSTHFSIWPFQFTINELSYRDRKKNVLMYGLWFGDKKPCCDTFLQPLKEEAQILGEEGLVWRNPLTGENVRSRFFFTTATCDAVARPIVRNCVQFNGHFGCDWCYHEGNRVARGRGYTRSYHFIYPEPERRTHNEIVAAGVAADLALLNNDGQLHRRGVKGSTYLSLLPNFDLALGFVVDYMHCVLLGVTKQLTTLWFDSSNHESDWYIGTFSDQVDESLAAIQPPTEITRSPRPLVQRKLWKASEWRTFLVYTAPIVLKDVLARRYYDHFLLLSTSIYILLKEGLSPEQVDNAELALNKFCFELDELYGVEHASFNIHQLTHICDSVRMWGPLYVTSAFPFEANNHTFMRMFQGKRYPAQQIARKITLKKGVEAIAREQMEHASEKVKRLYERLVHTGRYLLKKEIKIGPLFLYGKPTVRYLTSDTLTAVQHLLGEVADVPYYHYLRFSNGRFCAYSSDYVRGGMHEDDVVLLEGGDYCIVKEVVLIQNGCGCDDRYQCNCDCEAKPVIILEKCRTSKSCLFYDRLLRMGSDHFVQLRGTTETIAIHPNLLKGKCFIVEDGGYSYAVAMPNNFETD